MAQRQAIDFDPNKYYSSVCPETGEALLLPKGFSWDNVLGKGSQGTVFTVVPNEQNPAVKKYYAFKKVKREALAVDLTAKRAYREFMLLKDVEHRHIVKLLHAYTPQKTLGHFQDVYLVTEAHLTSLTQWVRGKKFQKAQLGETSSILSQLLSAVAYLHRCEIQHRDLKPDNIVITDNDLRLVDFGHACGIQPGGRPYTPYMVTRYYRAPEVFLEMGYSEKVDVWSIGCILAELINKDILFCGGDRYMDQADKIASILGPPSDEFIARVTPDYRRDVDSWKNYVAMDWNDILPHTNIGSSVPDTGATAENARDLLEKMLQMDAEKRPSVAECLAHQFVNFHNQAADQSTTKFEYDFALDEAKKEPEEWKEMLFRALKDYEGESTFLEEPSE